MPADGYTFKSSQTPDLIEIHFTEKIQVDSATVTVNNGQLTGTTSYDADNKTLTFKPTNGFYPGATYTATVKGVRDKANNTMAEKSVSFTIEALVVAADGRGNFSTIQAALDAASEGETVLIKAGTYNEAIRLKAGVHVRGEGAENTILTYSGDDNVVTAENCSSGDLTGVTVKYQGQGKRVSIWLISSDVTIKDCIVTGATLAGLEIKGTSQATIINNQIRGNGGSVYVYGDAKPIIKGNTIESNGRKGNLAGIEVSENAAPTIENNQIRGNGAGVFVHGDAKPIIKGNTIENNGQGSKLHGIEVKDRAAPTIENNQILNNGSQGIYVHGEARPNIASNVITGNPGYGIYISEQAQPTLKDNTIKDNESGDIYRR